MGPFAIGKRCRLANRATMMRVTVATSAMLGCGQSTSAIGHRHQTYANNGEFHFKCHLAKPLANLCDRREPIWIAPRCSLVLKKYALSPPNGGGEELLSQNCCIKSTKFHEIGEIGFVCRLARFLCNFRFSLQSWRRTPICHPSRFGRLAWLRAFKLSALPYFISPRHRYLSLHAWCMRALH